MFMIIINKIIKIINNNKIIYLGMAHFLTQTLLSRSADHGSACQ
jgi:hypothetical protein